MLCEVCGGPAVDRSPPGYGGVKVNCPRCGNYSIAGSVRDKFRQIDQAGWHLSTRLVVPANITIIPLPPKCPELNPVENVWQFLRDNWLSNRGFRSGSASPA